MPGMNRILLILALAAPAFAPAGAVVPEWNEVRTHAVEIGPEASRLMVGFRATEANAVVRQVRVRALPQSVKIVQAQTSAADVAALVRRRGVALAASRQITPSMHVLFLPKTLYGADLNAVLKKLRADPAVLFAAVDQRRFAHTLAPIVPNDPLFAPTAGASGQWFMQAPSSNTIILGGIPTQDLSATDAVDAWSITRGSTGTVIADVDTGVRFDHPDLMRAGFGGRLLPGYDFVDQDYNPNSPYNALGTYLIANDGDGWDPDPSDPGDWVSASDMKNTLFPPTVCGDPNNNDAPVNSSWHGTRVMGVLGAVTNNDLGVAGMTWNPYLLPVRALGKCGGYDSDIVAGMQWAAGLPVTDPSGNAVFHNPYPADIINLSLGGVGVCDSTTPYPNVIQQLTQLGVLIVASAGNESGPVDVPAKCPGVLAVAGLRNVGTKVGYSSFGSEVGISAPAGNCVTTTGTACYRSIDTTVNMGTTVPGANGYTDEANPNLGTSFSAPIVSGIAALMRAVNANLTPAQLIARMKSVATAFPASTSTPPAPTCATGSTGECACPNDGTQCGAGMVNALAAVNAALNPIAGITATGNTMLDASGSVAACNLAIASYAWSATTGITVTPTTGPQVTVTTTGTAGTVTLTVTDSAGHTDTGTVSFSAGGAATVNTPPSAGTAATACPTPFTFTPVAPTVVESFSPVSVNTTQASTLTISFTNPNPFALTQANFTETLPGFLVVQTSPAPTTTCSGASGTLTSSANAVTLTGAIIPTNAICSITLSVKGTTAGTYTHTIPAKALSTGPAGENAASAQATLTVTAPSGGGGGGVGWLDLLFAAGVLLAGRGRKTSGRLAA